MFAYCEECGYDTGDFGLIEELQDQVRDDGGEFYYTFDKGYVGQCPICGRKPNIQLDVWEG